MLNVGGMLKRLEWKQNFCWRFLPHFELSKGLTTYLAPLPRVTTAELSFLWVSSIDEIFTRINNEAGTWSWTVWIRWLRSSHCKTAWQGIKFNYSFTRLIHETGFQHLLCARRAACLWYGAFQSCSRTLKAYRQCHRENYEWTAIKFRSNKFFPSNVRSLSLNSWYESCFVANRVWSDRRWEKTDTRRTQLPQTDGRDGARAWPAIRAEHAGDDLGWRAGSQGAAVGERVYLPARPQPLLGWVMRRRQHKAFIHGMRFIDSHWTELNIFIVSSDPPTRETRRRKLNGNRTSAEKHKKCLQARH